MYEEQDSRAVSKSHCTGSLLAKLVGNFPIRNLMNTALIQRVTSGITDTTYLLMCCTAIHNITLHLSWLKTHIPVNLTQRKQINPEMRKSPWTLQKSQHRTGRGGGVGNLFIAANWRQLWLKTTKCRGILDWGETRLKRNSEGQLENLNMGCKVEYRMY